MARSTKRSKSSKVANYRKVSQRQDSVIERRLDRDDRLLDDPKNQAILSRADDDDLEAPPPKNNLSSTASQPSGYIDPSSVLSPELQEAMGGDAAGAVMVSSKNNKQKKKKREVELTPEEVRVRGSGDCQAHRSLIF